VSCYQGAALVIAASCGLVGCTVDSPVVQRPPTLGRELIDLQQARNDQLLSDSEYATQRQLIVDRFHELDQRGVPDAASR
jgi:hypothetical protein